MAKESHKPGSDLVPLATKKSPYNKPNDGPATCGITVFFFFFNGQLAIELKAVVTNKGGGTFRKHSGPGLTALPLVQQPLKP